MAMAYHKEKFLILANTYPNPSSKYRETNCVAAVSTIGKLLRLYPIPYRLLDGQDKFKKWEWVSAKIQKAKGDNRPESYRIDVDSIERHAKISTNRQWNDRLRWVRSHVIESFDKLEQRRKETGETLGVIGPVTLLGLDIVEQKDTDWTAKELTSLSQDGLFDSDEVRNRRPLRKLPYRFYYRYKLNGSEHRHLLTDWEVGALYWNCKQKYGQSWETKLRGRIEDEFAKKKDLLFLMGTVHRFPDTWLIVAMVYPPKGAFEPLQPSLFG